MLGKQEHNRCRPDHARPLLYTGSQTPFPQRESSYFYLRCIRREQHSTLFRVERARSERAECGNARPRDGTFCATHAVSTNSLPYIRRKNFSDLALWSRHPPGLGGLTCVTSRESNYVRQWDIALCNTHPR